MKWVVWGIRIVAALGGALLILLGALLRAVPSTWGGDDELGTGLVIGGILLLIATLLSHHRVVDSLERIWKYFWATKYRRAGFASATVTIAFSSNRALGAPHKARACPKTAWEAPSTR